MFYTLLLFTHMHSLIKFVKVLIIGRTGISPTFKLFLLIIVEWRYLELHFSITLAIATEIRLSCPFAGLLENLFIV